MKNKDLIHNLDKKFDDSLLKEAVLIRSTFAKSLASQYLQQYNDIQAMTDIKGTLLETFLERNPFDNCLQKLSFSQFLTIQSVDEILSSDRQPLEKIGIVGYLLELSGRDFIDPHSPDKKEKNLAASKKYGYFFTPISLAVEMSKLMMRSDPHLKSVLDPACGSGTLLAVSLVLNTKIEKVIAVEIDPFTSVITKKLLHQISNDLKMNPIINVLNMNFLDFIAADINQKLKIDKVDAIIMNPPYGRIRFITSNLTNFETKTGLNTDDSTRLKALLRKEHISNAQGYRKRFQDIGLGKDTPEYSTLFIGSSIQLLKKGGTLVAISPTSWLSDKSGKGLRKHIFENHGFEEVWNFKETAGMFPGVNQPTSVLLIKAGKKSKGIKIKADISSIKDLQEDVHDLDIEKIYQFSPGWLRIPRYGNSRGDLLAKLHLSDSLARHHEISNLRGEFDLTFNKDLIRKEKKEVRLVRGDHIKQYLLKEPEQSEKDGYVDSYVFFQRLGNSEKLQHISNWRIALPQCTYMQKHKRIEACLVPPNSIISNSCNYLILDQDNISEDALDRLLMYCVYLNSFVVEWRFRLFNSNNHIANYEIDELPIVNFEKMPSALKELILRTAKKYLVSRNELDLFKLEVLVAKSYKLNNDDFQIVLKDLSFKDTNILLNQYNNEYI
ncbi:MAG: Alw26I/Eco31I/Esp3I family type II restriction adenine-specific DNA-methyltransferase [Patescibacteria group bacterium]|nr:Alw26I/Eco31I/Esp3I family type II restriction adenine-specific DNA-methyltransferase [Patescibacteria group bacterium]